MSITLRFKGFDSVARAIKGLGPRAIDDAAGALYKEGNEAMTVAKRDFVPVDLGALRASGGVDLPERQGREIAVRLHFGGPAAPYALSVHEHPSDASPPQWDNKAVGDIHGTRTGQPWSESGRGPKYLERAAKAQEKGMAERIAKAVRL